MASHASLVIGDWKACDAGCGRSLWKVFNILNKQTKKRKTKPTGKPLCPLWWSLVFKCQASEHLPTCLALGVQWGASQHSWRGANGGKKKKRLHSCKQSRSLAVSPELTLSLSPYRLQMYIKLPGLCPISAWLTLSCHSMPISPSKLSKGFWIGPSSMRIILSWRHLRINSRRKKFLLNSPYPPKSKASRKNSAASYGVPNIGPQVGHFGKLAFKLKKLELSKREQIRVTYAKPRVTKLRKTYSLSAPRKRILNLSGIT